MHAWYIAAKHLGFSDTKMLYPTRVGSELGTFFGNQTAGLGSVGSSTHPFVEMCHESNPSVF